MKIGKIIMVMLIVFMLVGNVSAGLLDNYLLSDNPYMEEVSEFDSFIASISGELFTVVTSTTKTVEVGDDFIIAADETATKACSNAGLTFELRDYSNTLVEDGQGYLVTDSVDVGERLQKSFRFTVPSGYSDGIWTMKVEIWCLDTAEKISLTSTGSFSVGSASTCVEGNVGSPFCDRTANTLIQKYRNCVNGVEIIENRETQCSSSQICEDGACRTKDTSGTDDASLCGSRGGDICSSSEQCSSEYYSDISGCCKSYCYTPATCSDGIQNQGETGIDCGGPCAACSTDGNGDDTTDGNGVTIGTCSKPIVLKGCSETFTKDEFKTVPEAKLKASSCVEDTNCNPRVGYTVTCIDIAAVDREWDSGILLTLADFFGDVTEPGVCLATSTSEEESGFDISGFIQGILDDTQKTLFWIGGIILGLFILRKIF